MAPTTHQHVLRGEWTGTCRPSWRHSRWTFFLFTSRCSSWRSAAHSRPKPVAGIFGGVAAQPCPQISIRVRQDIDDAQRIARAVADAFSAKVVGQEV